jgi:hypothetical protein
MSENTHDAARPGDSPESFERAVFAALVTSQDQGCAVAASREAVAARFGIQLEEVLRVEREGIRSQWPPL